ncbi:MAG: metal ABC transporter ATP-binding protein [Candidatus Eisenbacteria sp.]|nr:metal ABC transporter ATP-binding protein [Candidatus Eisenbacteria bacterium]
MTENKDMPAVELRGIWSRYDGDWVLRNVSLTCPMGSIFGIVGPNGGGKTTLLRIILGLMSPDRGEVRVLGKVPRAPDRNHSDVGYLPQLSLAHRDFPVSALDVVLMGRYARLGILRRPGAGDRARALETLGLVGMADRAERPFGSLSGGEQQRVSIARALAGDPRLLLLDEPSTGIDAVGQESFYRLLADLRDRTGLAVVMVSHDIGVITAHTDRIACLNRTIHYHGAPDGCLNREILERTYGAGLQVVVHDRECPTCEDERDG